MSASRRAGMFLMAACLGLAAGGESRAQCCLTGLFGSCCRKPPAYAVAPVPVAPVPAPIMAPVPAPPPPVMVPVQQTSYVPETTYRTEYKCVPVTTYKPSCEVDPCTGCTVECMQPVTQYVQQPVSVPVTQYRAVTTTRYVQMQPGYGAAPGYAPVQPGMPAAPAASAFSAVQTTPQAWGAAGADISRQPLPGVAPPALPPATGAPAATYQPYQPPVAAPSITPQGGLIQAQTQQLPVQPQPTAPPALAPTPSLKPIPELPRTPAPAATEPAAATGGSQPAAGTAPATDGMPVLPGSGPGAATGAFPRLLEPTSHTTSWGPSSGLPVRVQYPTAALPTGWHGQR